MATAHSKYAFVKNFKVNRPEYDGDGELKKESMLVITMECQTNDEMVQMLTKATVEGKGVKFNPIQLSLSESRTA